MLESHRLHLAFIFLLAAVIWLPNLEVVPQWYWDEGVNLNYAKNLAEGRLLWFTLKYSFIPHPPFYIMVLALVVKAVGYTIIAARVLSVGVNFAVIYLLYRTGEEVEGGRTGLFASLLYTIYPSAVYWGRMGFSNNLLSLMVFSSLYCFVRYIKVGGRWWVPCCISAGLSTVTEPQGLPMAAALSLYFLVRQRTKAVWALTLLFGFFALFVLVMSLTSQYFMQDVMFQVRYYNIMRPHLVLALPLLAVLWWRRITLGGFISRILASEVQVIFQSKSLFNLFYVPVSLLAAHVISSITLIKPLTDEALFSGGDYYWLGIIGLLFLNPLYMNTLVLLYFMPNFLSVIAFGRSDHMLIPLYPFFALGLAVFLGRLYDHLKSRFDKRVVFLLLSYPLIFALFNGLSAFTVGGVLGSEPLADIRSVAGYVNSDSGIQELVLTTSNLVRYFPNATIITQAVVYDGYPVDYYHVGYTAERFIFNCSYVNAAYVVVPDGVLRWLGDYAPGPSGEISGWPVVNASGRYLVYGNPQRNL
jgi:4-amino-4-deoxy-L-arabinose transferase-like glycosyltransferase